MGFRVYGLGYKVQPGQAISASGPRGLAGESEFVSGFGCSSNLHPKKPVAVKAPTEPRTLNPEP